MAPLLLPPLHLSSGQVLRVACTGVELIPPGSAALLDAFDRGLFSLSTLEGSSIPVDSLSVEDFQVLRAYLTAQGVAREDPMTRPCSNCGELLEVYPCAAVTWSPFLHGDLDDSELDEPFPFEEPLDLGTPGTPCEVLLRPTTVAEARAVLLAPERLRPTAAQCKALGIVQLDQETRPGYIARALQRCDDEVWAALLDTIEQSWYPPRLSAWVSCPNCGARNIFQAPAKREFGGFPGASRWQQEEGEDFPDFEEFSARVEAHARQIFRSAGAEGVGLYVEGGPADCDEGGVPLLGSYEPGELEEYGVAGQQPEVTIYYRTFLAMHREDGPYDLDREIRETLEHELEHHRAFLAGYDPVDEEERAQIARELRGQLGGTEVLRRSLASVRRSVGDFFYRTWPLWVVVLVVSLLEVWASPR
ncbi:MAG: metallopeptidase family protein [Myxococcales bacterium]|nr:metallopeptidase family protein [Polyangiaceae bacterium]MDW8248692.1 metallopeptidase family protein [Myxococcales bacterium]